MALGGEKNGGERLQASDLLPDEGVDTRSLCLIAAFLAEIHKAESLVAIEAVISAISHELGFRHYAMIHHDDHRTRSPGLINLNNYPPEYAAQYFGDLYYRDDPVVHACLAANACFTWCDMAQLIELGRQHRDILERGAYYGVTNGLTVPAFVLGERSGSCSFSSPRVPGCARRHLWAVHTIGGFAFQKARRIVNGGRLRQVRAARLRPRWRECVVLAGQGKSNTDIATILGLTPSTVKTYIEAACRSYGVANRTQLVLAAVLDGEVGIYEIAPRQHRHLAT